MLNTSTKVTHIYFTEPDFTFFSRYSTNISSTKTN